MERIWAVYRLDTNNNPFGRDHVGFCGWHDNATTAMAEAIRRNPDIDPSVLSVSST